MSTGPGHSRLPSSIVLVTKMVRFDPVTKRTRLSYYTYQTIHLCFAGWFNAYGVAAHNTSADLFLHLGDYVGPTNMVCLRHTLRIRMARYMRTSVTGKWQTTSFVLYMNQCRKIVSRSVAQWLARSWQP